MARWAHPHGDLGNGHRAAQWMENATLMVLGFPNAEKAMPRRVRQQGVDLFPVSFLLIVDGVVNV
jgi:hypothetical protein